MTQSDLTELLRTNALQNLDELFNTVHGLMLDEGDSMFPTLATISGVEASKPVTPAIANLAAQVHHTAFYIDVLLDQIKGADWDASFRITSVTDVEWADLIANLESRYQRMKTTIETREDWDDDFIGTVLALIGHCAYHLGQIREGMAVVQGA